MYRGFKKMVLPFCVAVISIVKGSMRPTCWL